LAEQVWGIAFASESNVHSVPGTKLAAVIAAEGALEVARGLGMLRQVVSALAAAHAVGVIHRDLNPSNVAVVKPPGEPEQVKVLDFGLAKIRGALESSILSRQGLSYGTPEYMTPEIIEGVEADSLHEWPFARSCISACDNAGHIYRKNG
jgi:serine/threonine-protein kinase